tara:strand:+ start:9668 stop:10819 length:1152 start_codon:yes stop_codon:yes gene_type:complete
MHVCIINTLYYPFSVGGAEKSVQMLAEGLIEKGCKVSVVTLSEKNGREMVNGVSVNRLSLSNIYWPFVKRKRASWVKILWHLIDQFNIFSMFKVYDVLKEIKPDVVHTNNLSGFSVSIWFSCWVLKLPILHTCRDYYLFNHTAVVDEPGRGIMFLPFLLKKHCSKLVDRYVGISRYIYGLHNDHGFFKNTCGGVVYNSVDHQSSMVERKSEDMIRIGFIGRLNYSKGYDLFLSICSSYADCQGVRIQAVVAGIGDEEFVLESEKEISPRLDLLKLGHVQLSEFLEVVDCVVLPVRWAEPFGRVVVECAFSGLPVYVSNYGGIPELENIFPNVKFLNNTNMNDIPISEIKKYFEVGQSAVEIFSVNAVAKSYLKIYEELVLKNK